ncbi:ribosome maturation factor RimM [Candidatus Hydrogenedentota bacterium]
MQEQELIVCGKVVSTQVPKRRLRIVPWRDRGDFLLDAGTIVVSTVDGAEMEFEPVSVRVAGNKYVAQLADSVSFDEVGACRKGEVFVRSGTDDELEEGEFFLSRVPGYRVLSETEEEIGVVREVYDSLAHQIFEIDLLGNRGELLIPVIPEVVVKVDNDQKLIIVGDYERFLEENQVSEENQGT